VEGIPEVCTDDACDRKVLVVIDILIVGILLRRAYHDQVLVLCLLLFVIILTVALCVILIPPDIDEHALIYLESSLRIKFNSAHRRYVLCDVHASFSQYAVFPIARIEEGRGPYGLLHIISNERGEVKFLQVRENIDAVDIPIKAQVRNEIDLANKAKSAS
jgi:hypothetical protein